MKWFIVVNGLISHASIYVKLTYHVFFTNTWVNIV